MYRSLTEADHEERARRAAELVGGGWSHRKIAAELGCDTDDVGGYLDAAGASRNPRNGHVPAGKVSLNAIRRAGGQHLDTIKKVLATGGVAIERVTLSDGRLLLLVDEAALRPLRCPHGDCEALATVAATGTCKRHSRAVVTCAHCGTELRRSPAHLNPEGNFCGWRCWGRYRWERGLVTSLVETMSGNTRRAWKLRWAPKPGRRRNADRKDHVVSGVDHALSFDEVLALVQARYEEFHETERVLVAELGVSKRTVRIALGRPV